MTVKIKDGITEVNISAKLNADELVELIRTLCSAHAEITTQRVPDGTPLFFVPGSTIDLFTAKDMSLILGIRNPVVGCVSTTINPASFGTFLSLFGNHLNNLWSSNAANAAITERQISGANLQ